MLPTFTGKTFVLWLALLFFVVALGLVFYSAMPQWLIVLWTIAAIAGSFWLVLGGFKYVLGTRPKDAAD
jgi:uncharacterized membrane protein